MSRGRVKQEDILAGNRRSLARAITLIESTRRSDLAVAEALLTSLLPHTGKAFRIGISGAPGAGKSTFVEALGTFLIGHGHRVAVLAVDPTSPRSGGSILGDKTRMERLARDPHAFIRPSPSGPTLGGVARRTCESVLLVEAAGFDVVLVETVGVGQSETAVAEMVDLLVLLVSPGGGDELQGIKRGITELADLVLVTKADGDLLDAATRAASDYVTALHLLRPKYADIPVRAIKVSALENRGIQEAWSAIRVYRERLEDLGHLRRLREEQVKRWFWSEVQAALSEAIASDPRAEREAGRVEGDVIAGRVLPHAAARRLLATVLGWLDGPNCAP